MPLVERPLADGADDGDAIARVLDAERVVVDEGAPPSRFGAMLDGSICSCCHT